MVEHPNKRRNSIVTNNSNKKSTISPIHTNAFLKVSVFIAAKTKQNIFIRTNVFNLSTLKRPKTMKRLGPGTAQHNIIRHLGYMLRFGLEPGWHVTLFTSPFSEVSAFTCPPAFSKVFKSLQKSPILKPFSKVSVFIVVFGHFSVDYRRKRFKIRYVFKRISVNGSLSIKDKSTSLRNFHHAKHV